MRWRSMIPLTVASCLVVRNPRCSSSLAISRMKGRSHAFNRSWISSSARISSALSQRFGVYPALSMRSAWVPPNRRWRMILNALVEKLRRRSKDDFKGRHFEATLILQAVSWYLRYPLSYRDIEELFLERGLAVDHSTLNRWVLAYAPLIERRLRSFRQPHCGSIRIDETYTKLRGQWRYLYRAIDKHGTPVDFLLTAKRDLKAAKRFFRKMLKDGPLLAPDRIGTDGTGISLPAG